MTSDRPHGAPEFHKITLATLALALRLGWRDMVAAPKFGVLFALPYIAGGLAFVWITQVTGQSYWLIFAALGFPLFAPLASVGLYEVSRRRKGGQPLDWGPILGVIVRQRSGQLPWLSAVVVVIFLFWFFLGHMIFALFLGLSTMTNISSSFDVYLTQDGLTMLAVGSAVGAVFAFVSYAVSVMGIPMLLDREVDFMTAMLTSFQVVLDNLIVLMVWAALIAVLTALAMVPVFFGLLIVFPLLGHASWHLYHAAQK